MKISGFDKSPVNAAALHEALAAALGSVFLGVNKFPGGVLVYLDDSASLQQQAQVEQVVLAHDPAALTAGQQAEQDRRQHPFFTATEAELGQYFAGLSELERWQALVKFIIWTRDRVI